MEDPDNTNVNEMEDPSVKWADEDLLEYSLKGVGTFKESDLEAE